MTRMGGRAVVAGQGAVRQYVILRNPMVAASKIPRFATAAQPVTITRCQSRNDNRRGWWRTSPAMALVNTANVLGASEPHESRF